MLESSYFFSFPFSLGNQTLLFTERSFYSLLRTDILGNCLSPVSSAVCCLPHQADSSQISAEDGDVQNNPKPAPVSFNRPGKNAGRRLSRGRAVQGGLRHLEKHRFLRTLSPALSWKIKPLLASIPKLQRPPARAESLTPRGQRCSLPDGTQPEQTLLSRAARSHHKSSPRKDHHPNVRLPLVKHSPVQAQWAD